MPIADFSRISLLNSLRRNAATFSAAGDAENHHIHFLGLLYRGADSLEVAYRTNAGVQIQHLA